MIDGAASSFDTTSADASASHGGEHIPGVPSGCETPARPAIMSVFPRRSRYMDDKGSPMRVFNFSAGPAVMPEDVLRTAAAEMLDWHGSGMSVMEMSHRGKEFIGIYEKAQADLRGLLKIPANYKILFLQGGAIAENAIVPMNLLRGRTVADYVHTGEWSKKSIKEA